MKSPNRFLIVQGIVLLVLMVIFGIWCLIAKSKFLTIVLLILAIIMAVSGITSLIIAFRDNKGPPE